MGLPFLLLFGGDPPTEARVTQVVRSVLGAPAGDPAAHVTRVTRSTLGAPATPATARVTRIVRQVLGEPIPVTFDNGTTLIGLTWLELTRRDGSVLVVARVPLDDPPSYYHGYKSPFVLSWGPIRRDSSDWLGQFVAADLKLDLTDHTGILRTIADADDFANLYGVVRSIDDASRRRQWTPTTVFRGPVREDSPAPNLRYSLTLKDPLQERFASSVDSDQLPQRRVTQLDFPNCHNTVVRSSAWDYTVDGAVAGGETRIAVTAGYGTFANGDKVTFGTDPTVYSVSGSSGTSDPAHIGRDPEIWIDVSPALGSPLAGGEAIAVAHTHRVDPALGKAVPFWYGHITDLKAVGGVDQGDGQGPVLYVGDRVLDDGKVYGEFLWAGHACYSPSSAPIPSIYFWNDPLEIHVGSGNFPELATYATEATSGRIVAPGWTNWSTLIGPHSYVDYNGRRYTTIFLRGIYRDWALGITDAPANLGGTPFAVDAYGAETQGDGTGSLILNLFDQWLHAIRNHVLPVGGYQGGLWRTSSPTFPDDATLPMIADGSFYQAKARSIARIGGVGYRGDWGVGANDETIPVRELFARLAVSSRAEIGWTRKCQLLIDFLDDDVDTAMVGAPTFDDVRDIFDQSFRPERVERELYSVLPYVHTRDFFNRAQGGWRSVTCSDAGPTGETTTTDSAAVTKFGTIKSPRLEFHCLRGQNRASDSDEYAQGTLTIADVLSRTIARSKQTPNYVTFLTGPRGYNVELFDRIWISHFEQLGGRTLRPYRVVAHHARPDDWTVELKCQDLAHILS